MALIGKMEISGFTVDNVYVRVSRFEGTKNKAYFDADYCASSKDAPIKSERFNIDSFNLDGGNPIEQAYLFLKSTQRFCLMADC